MIGTYRRVTAQLPPSGARTAWIDECGGHALYAAGGTIYERVVTADGSLDFVKVTRHQTKRDRKPDGTWAFYARHTLTCRSTDDIRGAPINNTPNNQVLQGPIEPADP